MVPEKVSPAIIAPPRPRQSGSDSVIGIKPIIVQKLVNAIGSNLLAAASAMASFNSIPDFSFLTILSTTKIEFLTTIPNNAKIPINAGKDSGILNRANIINTPDIESGITNITIVARLNDEN